MRDVRGGREDGKQGNENGKVGRKMEKMGPRVRGKRRVSTCYSSGRGRGNKGLKGVFGIMIERQQEESKSESKCRCLLLESSTRG